MKRRCSLITICAIAIALTVGRSAFCQGELADALATINGVGNNGIRHSEAIQSWRKVSRSDATELPTLIMAIDDQKPLAANWIRAAVDQIAERNLQNGRKLPNEALERLVFNQDVSPRARRLAYEWLAKADEAAEQRIIPKMLNDTSLEMRRDAVAQVIQQAEAAEADEEKKKNYWAALTAARDKDQIDSLYDKLTEMGDEVNLAEHFGFITTWNLIGPFDNVDKKGFAVAYPPESEVVLNKAYSGKTDEVQWIEHTTDQKYGMVNLNEAIGKNMGAAAYAYAEFNSPTDRTVDLRLGSICAAKLWLNGDQLMEHEVYHSGTKIDQYVTKAKLKAGKNAILLKICQNEQTERWAQDWEFQFRVCDNVGTAIYSQ